MFIFWEFSPYININYSAQNNQRRMNSFTFHNLGSIRKRCKKSLLYFFICRQHSSGMNKDFRYDTSASLLALIGKRPCFASVSVSREYPYLKDEEQYRVPIRSGDFETAVDFGFGSCNALVPIATALSERRFWSRSLRQTVTFVQKWRALAARRYAR